ncbi:MAG: GIY-YIG nuclease family protein [Terriglobales bacterium]
MSAKYFVYVLRSEATGRFYTGVTLNPASRLAHHNRQSKNWTARQRPWTLAWKSQPQTQCDAIKLERRLKHQHRGRGFFALTRIATPPPSDRCPASR